MSPNQCCLNVMAKENAKVLVNQNKSVYLFLSTMKQYYDKKTILLAISNKNIC